MSWTAAHNLTSVAAVVKDRGPRMQAEVKELGEARLQLLFRFHAAELNRYYFLWWERVQIPLGLALAILLLFSTNGNRLLMTLVMGMMAMVVAQHVVLAPQIVELGRALDFVPAGEFMRERPAFRTYHGYYATLEVAKLVMGLVLAGRLLYSSRRPRRVRRPADA